MYRIQRKVKAKKEKLLKVEQTRINQVTLMM